MRKISLEQVLAFFAVVLSAIFLRLIPHIPNVTPIGALALFSGITVPAFGGVLIPLIALIISDAYLGFHATIPYVYGSFILITGIGYLLRNRMSPVYIGTGSVFGSVLFFIITNFGAWMTSSHYQKSAGGLLDAYIMGLPFFRNTLVGDLFYNAVFFAGYWGFSIVSKYIVNSIKNLVRYHLS